MADSTRHCRACEAGPHTCGLPTAAERLWEKALSLRDGYPGNGFGIGYINGWEDAAAFVEAEVRRG